MDEELQKESQNEIMVKTETSQQTESGLESLPRLEDLLKSEKAVKTSTEIKGVQNVEQEVVIENRTFAREADKKKVLMRKRLKIVTSVYATIVALLLTFVGVNLATLVMLNKDIDNCVNTKQIEQARLSEKNKNVSTPSGEEITITLNNPRDYSDDEKDLSFFDKLTIVFKNLFG